MTASEQTNNNRMVLLLIAGVPLIMILGASWLWYFVVRGDLDLVGVLGTANRGVLVQPPRQIDEWQLLDQAGMPFQYADMEPKWTLLVAAGGDQCGTSCENTLYITRQIHIALGKEFNRVRRLYVSDAAVQDTDLAVAALSDEHALPDSFAAYLGQEHRGLRPLVVERGAMDEMFPERGANASTWYLVDPGGWIMMTYTSDTSYKDVIADLKFLLKNSAE